MALRTVGIRLTAEISQYMTNIKNAGTATRSFAHELDASAKAGKLDAVAERAGTLGLGLAGVAAGAIKMSADFDKSMSAVGAATHAGAAEIGQLRQAALQAGKDTQFSATGAADAITELSKAGVHTADILGGGLKGALSLAAAGQMDVGEAAETAASAMTQFGLSGDKVPHVADLLAAAAGKAQGSVHDIGAALNQSGLVAAQFGLSIEDTTGALAEFANAGLIGSDAGTSFKTMLLAIANPSTTTAKQMQALGISFYDAQGKFIGLNGVAEVLRQKLGDLTEQQRQQALGQIFGSDAIRAATILYKDGAAGVEQWKNGVNQAGYATDTAAKLTDNLSGDLERLKGSLETLAIQSGSGANGGLRVLTKSLEGIVDRFGDLPPVIGSGITVLAGMSGAALLLGSGWIKLRGKTADVLDELSKTGPVGERAAAGLERTTKWAGRAALAFGAMQIAAVAISAAGNDLNPQIDALGSGLEQFSSSGKLSGEAARLLGGDMGKLDTAMKDVADTGRWSSFSRGFGSAMESISGTGHTFDDSLTNSRDRLQAVDQALQQLVTSGNGAQAAQIFQTLADRAAKQGVSVKELKAVLPGYAASLENVGKASSGTAGATGDLNSALDMGAAAQDDYKTKADSVAGVVRGETDALISLSKQLRAQVDPAFALIDAQNSLAKAHKAADQAAEKYGKNSKEARAANRELALSAIDLEGKVGEAAKTFDGKLDPALKATLKAGGLTERQIADIAQQFADAKKSADKYSDKYEAKVSAPGAKQAKKEIDDAYSSAHHLDGTWQAKTSAPGAKQAKIDLSQAHTAATDFDGLYKAATSAPGAKDAKNQLSDAHAAASDFDGVYKANLWVTNYPDVKDKLLGLLAAQKSLRGNQTIQETRRELSHFLAGGGPVRGPGGPTDDQVPAWLSNDEHVWTAAEVVAVGGHQQMMRLRAAAAAGKRIEVGDDAPGFAAGGPVRNMPFPTSVQGTKIPEMAYGLPGGGGAPGYKWMERVVRQAFPGMAVYSDFRPGAITLTGNRSYHGFGRAVDFAPSRPLAEWINLHFMKATKELITPWQSLNIHNGARHQYSALIENQHNFAGGNAHDHWAMRNGGTISEPVFGVGASGNTYSFGENYQPERVIPNWQGAGGSGGGVTNLSVTINAPIGSHPRDIGAAVVGAIGDYLEGGGELRVRGQKVL